MRYIFNKIDSCNMCGDKTDHHKIIGRRLNTHQGLRPSKKVGIATTVLRCTKCDLIYSNPQPIPENIQDHYGVMPESYWTEAYMEMNVDLGGLIGQLKKELDFSQNLTSLDIGAGIGKSMIALKKEGFDVYGIEPSNQFYAKALSLGKIPADKLLCESIENASFDENKFDFITFGAVLEHLGNPAESLEKAIHWLKPGGIIQVQVPSSNWLITKLLNLVYKTTFSRFCSNLSPMHSPFHLYEFGLKSFQVHASKNGYGIVDYNYEVCNTFMPKSLDFILKPIMRKTNTGMEIYLLLKKNKQ